MGVAFVTTGVLVLIGALGLAATFPAGRLARFASVLFCLESLGWILVGLFPGDGAEMAPTMHVIGALLTMPMANIALILLGISLRSAGRRRAMSTAAIALGVLGFVCVFLVTPLENAGWNGAVQRLAVFPQILWMIVYGSRMLTDALYQQRSPAPDERSEYHTERS